MARVPMISARGNVALRIFHFAARKREVGKPIVRPEHRDQRESECPNGDDPRCRGGQIRERATVLDPQT